MLRKWKMFDVTRLMQQAMGNAAEGCLGLNFGWGLILGDMTKHETFQQVKYMMSNETNKVMYMTI